MLEPQSVLNLEAKLCVILMGQMAVWLHALKVVGRDAYSYIVADIYINGNFFFVFPLFVIILCNPLVNMADPYTCLMIIILIIMLIIILIIPKDLALNCHQDRRRGCDFLYSY